MRTLNDHGITPAQGHKTTLNLARRLLFAGLLATAACSAQAATYNHQVLLNTDNNTATGCAVPVSESGYSGTVNGVEHIVEMRVDDATAPARVIQVDRYSCPGGTMGAPIQVDAGDWNAGTDNGTGGADVVEGYVTRAGLGNPSQMKVTFYSTSAQAPGSDVMAVPAALSLSALANAVPSLSQWGVLLLSLLVAFAAFRLLRRRVPTFMALAMAVVIGVAGHPAAEAAVATILMDGNVSDWTGIGPVATDPTGDTSNASPPEDIVAGFVAWDAQKVYFRVDLQNASIVCPPGMVPDQFNFGTCI